MNKKKTFSGYFGDCSEQQLEVLTKFRNKIRQMGCTDPRFDDVYLLRFLRARKFDFNATVEMWNNHITWRKEKKVDQVYHMEFPELKEAKKYYPHLWFRTDKLGRPIFIERVGKINFDKLMKVISFERIEQHFIKDHEKLLNEIFPACSKARGEVVCSTCYIMDMKGAAAKMMSPKVWDLLKMISKMGQDYYPEILGHMFIVNVPLFFYGIWNIVKHFVDEKTRKKIHILGSSYKKELLQYVDEKDLPDFLGGKATVEDYGENLTNEQGPWMKTRNIMTKDLERKVSTDVEDERNSFDLNDEEEDEINKPEDFYAKSLPVLDCYKSIEELGDYDQFEIGQESPLKVSVKNFRSKPSMSFTVIPI